MSKPGYEQRKATLSVALTQMESLHLLYFDKYRTPPLDEQSEILGTLYNLSKQVSSVSADLLQIMIDWKEGNE